METTTRREKMDKNEKIVGGLIATLVGVTGLNYVRIIREERAKRKAIEADSAKALKAIHIAQGRVLERIENGSHSGKSFQTIMNDFRFEEMMERNKLED